MSNYPLLQWLKARAKQVWLLILFVPLIVALTWGTFLEKNAYVTFAYARNLVAGRQVTYGLALAGAPLAAPLYVAALASLNKVGIPLAQAGLVLSSLGWGATALTLYYVALTMGQPLAATVSAALMVLNPFMVSTLGTEIPWVLALSWTAIALALKKRWRTQTAVLVLMLGTHFHWSTLVLVTLLLGLRWAEEKRFPLRPSLVLTITALVWALVATRNFGTPFSPLQSLVAPGRHLQQLTGESELYWLSLPLMGLGCLAVKRKAVWAGLLWGAFTLVIADPVGEPAAIVASPFLASLGIDWTIKWLDAQDSTQLDHRMLTVGLVLIAALPLGIAQATSLYHRYQARPLARHAIERQVGDWLSARSEPEDTVFGSRRIACLAHGPAVLWDGRAQDQVEMSSVMDVLNARPPRYCVSFNTIAWSWLTRTGWFQDRYEPLQTFETPYDSTSPFTVWGYCFSEFDGGEPQSARTALPNGIALVDWRYWPKWVEPGDAVYVTLRFQATQPVTVSFRTIVRVFSPTDGASWAQRDVKAPRSMPIDWWQAGQVIAERYVLTTTMDMPVGAYPLDISVPGSDVEGLALGYVAVPWRGKMEGATSVEATFSDQIRLVGFERLSSLSAGTEVAVTLYWDALRPPDDNYTVFVHLIGPDGHQVSGHDGLPMDGRYPTRGWLPGKIVPDTHRFVLGSGIPAGTYRLQVGMYQWPSLERLPVWNHGGEEQPDRTLLLQTLEIP